MINMHVSVTSYDGYRGIFLSCLASGARRSGHFSHEDHGEKRLIFGSFSVIAGLEDVGHSAGD